jgi:hypothetical protein
MITIDRWIDINSPEYDLTPEAKSGRRLIERGLACAALITDKDGRIFCNPIDPNAEKIPLNDTYKGQTIGFRIPARASN